MTVTQPLHTGTQRATISACIADLIHAETVKQALEKLTVMEQAAKARQVDVLLGCDVRRGISSAGSGKMIVEVFSPAIFSSVPR